VPEVSAELNFTPEVLAGIFLGKITKCNDPALQTANPGVKLPASGIVVVHRSEASGTTYVWVDYLSKISLEWKNKIGVGFSVAWPVGLGGKGNADGQNLTAPLSYSRVPPSVIAKEMQTIQQLQY
jgi:phosphate transport system substrate-binding protein